MRGGGGGFHSDYLTRATKMEANKDRRTSGELVYERTFLYNLLSWKVTLLTFASFF